MKRTRHSLSQQSSIVDGFKDFSAERLVKSRLVLLCGWKYFTGEGEGGLSLVLIIGVICKCGIVICYGNKLSTISLAPCSEALIAPRERPGLGPGLLGGDL